MRSGKRSAMFVCLVIICLFVHCLQNRGYVTNKVGKRQNIHKSIGDKSYSMVIPYGYTPIFKEEFYEEGGFHVFSFPHGAYIIVFHGALMEFQQDSYDYEYIRLENDVRKEFGNNEVVFWRKDVHKDFKVYYDNVQKKEKVIYDAILDSFYADDSPIQIKIE